MNKLKDNKKGRKRIRLRLRREQRENQGLWIWLTLTFTLVMLVALLAVSCGSNLKGSSDVKDSATRRTRLASGLVTETGFYTDNTDRLGRNNATLQKGMKYFYNQTGIQPYLYLTSSLGTPGAPDSFAMENYAEMLYTTLFRDEAHLLLLIYENEQTYAGYQASCRVGSAAEKLMDQEAVDILLEYLESAYFNEEYSSSRRDQMYSDVFRNTARNIMDVKDRSPWIIALSLMLAVFVLLIVLDFRKAWRADRMAERKNSGAKGEGETSVKPPLNLDGRKKIP